MALETALLLQDYSFFKELCELPYVDAIYLHGSRTRGEYEPQSDVDIAILCPDATDEQWRHILDIINNRDLLLKVETNRLDKVPPGRFKRFINQTKQLLYMSPTNTHIEVLGAMLEQNIPLLDTLEKDCAKAGKDASELATLMHGFHRNFHHNIRMCRRALLAVGIRVEPPVLVLREAWTCGWMEDHKQWELLVNHAMMAKEKPAAHLAEEIKNAVPAHIELIRKLQNELKQLYSELAETDEKEQGVQLAKKN